MIGLGPHNFSIAIYIANRPELDNYPNLNCLQPMKTGEIAYIGQETGNHWRKIFNVSAKLVFELLSQDQAPNTNFLPSTWQLYRDQVLYQDKSPIALLFSPPQFEQNHITHIVAGRTYAKELGLKNLVWLDEQFAICETHRLIVCPYLDYRQLSNARITRLVALIKKMQNK